MAVYFDPGYWQLPDPSLSLTLQTLHLSQDRSNHCEAEFSVGNKDVFAFSVLSQHKAATRSLMKYKNLFILHCQYYGFWWLGNARIQFISSHDIELDILKYHGLSTRRVTEKCWYLYPIIHFWSKDNFEHICDSHSHQSGLLEGEAHCIYAPGFVKRTPYVDRSLTRIWLDDANGNMTVNSWGLRHLKSLAP